MTLVSKTKGRKKLYLLVLLVGIAITTTALIVIPLSEVKESEPNRHSAAADGSPTISKAVQSAQTETSYVSDNSATNRNEQEQVPAQISPAAIKENLAVIRKIYNQLDHQTDEANVALLIELLNEYGVDINLPTRSDDKSYTLLYVVLAKYRNMPRAQMAQLLSMGGKVYSSSHWIGTASTLEPELVSDLINAGLNPQPKNETTLATRSLLNRNFKTHEYLVDLGYQAPLHVTEEYADGKRRQRSVVKYYAQLDLESLTQNNPEAAAYHKEVIEYIESHYEVDLNKN